MNFNSPYPKVRAGPNENNVTAYQASDWFDSEKRLLRIESEIFSDESLTKPLASYDWVEIRIKYYQIT